MQSSQPPGPPQTAVSYVIPSCCSGGEHDCRFNVLGHAIQNAALDCVEEQISSHQCHNEINFFVPEVPTVKTQDGTIQFGCPPESAKYWMRKGQSVPTTYVLPDPFFRNNTNYADVEFPIYWYAFVQKWVYEGKKLTIVGTPEQIKRMRVILTETIFGPSKVALERAGHKTEDINRVLNESHYFAAKTKQGVVYTLDDFVRFVEFDKEGNASVGQNSRIVVTRAGKDQFVVNDGGKVSSVEFKTPVTVNSSVRGEPIVRPKFGVTFLGTSSGFDPEGHTTSGIIWMDGKGLLIDPLAYVGSHLKTIGIEPIDVPDVLLTHVHGDHDPGLLEYILTGKKVRLFTSRIIYESFLRKAFAITGQDFSDKVEFVELVPGQRTRIRGEFYVTARNNFHSIPTIGCLFEGPHGTLAFSGDTYYNPTVIAELEGLGTLSKERAREIIDPGFFRAKHVIHEQGIPPIHTPKDSLVLASQDRVNPIILVHTTQPKKAEDLSVAKPCQHIEFVRGAPSFEERLELLKAVFFEDNADKFVELIGSDDLKKSEIYSKDQVIVKQGDAGRAMFVILDGEVFVVKNGETVARLAKGNCFGAQSALLGRPSSVDIKANTPVTVLRFSEEALAKFTVQNDKIRKTAEKFNLFSSAIFQSEELKQLPIDSIHLLASKLEVVNYNKDDVVVREGEPGNDLYIVFDGEASVELSDRKVLLGKGEIFGEMALIKGKDVPRSASVTAHSSKLTVLKLSRTDFEELKRMYPMNDYVLTELAQRRNANTNL